MSADDILAYIGEINIFAMYVPNLELYKLMSAPYRNDGTPSFIVYNSHYSYNPLMKLFWVDFAHKGRQFSKGNVFHFVREMFNLTFKQALERILHDYQHTPPMITHQRTKKDLNITFTPDTNYTYFSPLEIPHRTFDKFQIRSAKQIFANGKLKFSNPDTFVYQYSDKCKVYQPLNKKDKWYGNVTSNSIIGGEQLDVSRVRSGRKVLLTKSHKDVAFLDSEIPAIAFQSETVVRFDTLDYLLQNGVELVINYDNDTTGKQMSKIVSDYYREKGGIATEVFVPVTEKFRDIQIKDFTDLAFIKSAHYAKQQFRNAYKDNAISTTLSGGRS
jgi:hypothetical protein